MTATTDLSVCICTANRAKDLAFTLDKLATLRLPANRNVQFIVVDNASSDATQAVLADAAQRLPFALEVHNEPQRGLAAARNCALRHARGEIIAWTDDDCVPEADWVERMLAHFDEDPALDFLTGRVELYDQTHCPVTINTSREPAILDEMRAYANFVIGCNMAFRRSLVHRLGLFDPRFGAGAPLRAGEDSEFAFRALRAGCRIAYTPDVVLYHNHKRVTHEQVMRLRRNYIFADGALLMKHVLSGDGTAARWFYWRLHGTIGRVVHPAPWLPSRSGQARLLLDFLGGAASYLRHATAGLTRRHAPSVSAAS